MKWSPTIQLLASETPLNDFLSSETTMLTKKENIGIVFQEADCDSEQGTELISPLCLVGLFISKKNYQSLAFIPVYNLLCIWCCLSYYPKRIHTLENWAMIYTLFIYLSIINKYLNLFSLSEHSNWMESYYYRLLRFLKSSRLIFEWEENILAFFQNKNKKPRRIASTIYS